VYNSLIKELKEFINIDYISINLLGESGEPASLAFVWTEKTLEQVDEEKVKQIASASPLVDEIKYEPNLDTQSKLQWRVSSIGICSVICLPLRSKGTILGNLSLGSSKPQAYSEDNLRLLRQVALQIAIAVDNSRLYRLEKKAREDVQKEFEERAELLML